MHQFRSIIITLLLIVNSATLTAEYRQSTIQPNWQLIVLPLPIPPKWSQSGSFHESCYQSLKRQFEGTLYEVVKYSDIRQYDSSNGKKRDLIIEPEKQTALQKRMQPDTLAFWLKFRTGFKYSRITILLKKENYTTLCDSVAMAVYKTAQSEFLGEMVLQGGPIGCTMSISELFNVSPPCRLRVPVGIYDIKTSFPGFIPRNDSVSVYAGESVKKRVLLLPVE
jgi:hypothetical protein